MHRAEVSQRPEHASSFAETARRNLVLEDQLAELRREHDELRRTMYEGAQVQRKLCGPRQVRRESFEIASELFPVRHLSGDFISVFEVDSDIVFAIGDIAGKGLYAGIWFTYVVSMVRLQIDVLGDPAAAVSAINRDLLRTGLEVPLSSLLLARLNPKSGEFRYCNAGHPPALLLRPDGRVEQLQEGGPLLGVLAEASFTNGKFTMRPGDTLLGYSDGITECRNPMGAEFGLDQLLATARISHACTASSTLFSVLGAVEDFAGSHPREDDMALIVVHRGNE
jgi:sigma-B regulation protein RsbU (phosphoserine phosphatase)